MNCELITERTSVPPCLRGEHSFLLMYYKAGHTRDSHLFEVWLDGSRLPLCVEASATMGWATSLKADAAGAIEKDCFGRARTETRFGTVQVRRCGYGWGPDS